MRGVGSTRGVSLLMREQKVGCRLGIRLVEDPAGASQPGLGQAAGAVGTPHTHRVTGKTNIDHVSHR